MQIPHTEVKASTLKSIVLEFVSRDGTDHTSVDQRIESVIRQLENGQAELHFDPETETCNIVKV